MCLWRGEPTHTLLTRNLIRRRMKSHRIRSPYLSAPCHNNLNNTDLPQSLLGTLLPRPTLEAKKAQTLGLLHNPKTCTRHPPHLIPPRLICDIILTPRHLLLRLHFHRSRHAPRITLPFPLTPTAKTKSTMMKKARTSWYPIISLQHLLLLSTDLLSPLKK